MMRVLALALLVAAADVMAYRCCSDTYDASGCRSYCERVSCRSGYRGENLRKGHCKWYWLGGCKRRCTDSCHEKDYGCGCGGGQRKDCGDNIFVCPGTECPPRCNRVEIYDVKESGKTISPNVSRASVTTEAEHCEEGVEEIVVRVDAQAAKEETVEESYSFTEGFEETFSRTLENTITVTMNAGFEVPLLVSASAEVSNAFTMSATKGWSKSMSKTQSKSTSNTRSIAIAASGEVIVKKGFKITLQNDFSGMDYKAKFSAKAKCLDKNGKQVGNTEVVEGNYSGQGFTAIGNFRAVQTRLCVDSHVAPAGCECVAVTRKDGANFPGKCTESPSSKVMICYVKAADSCKVARPSSQSDNDYVMCEVNANVGDDEGPKEVDCLEAEMEVCQEEDHCTYLPAEEGFEGGCFETAFIEMAETIRDAQPEEEECDDCEPQLVPCTDVDDFRTCKQDRDDCTWFGRQVDGFCEFNDYINCDAGGKKMNKKKCEAIEGCKWANRECTQF